MRLPSHVSLSKPSSACGCRTETRQPRRARQRQDVRQPGDMSGSAASQHPLSNSRGMRPVRALPAEDRCARCPPSRRPSSKSGWASLSSSAAPAVGRSPQRTRLPTPSSRRTGWPASRRRTMPVRAPRPPGRLRRRPRTRRGNRHLRGGPGSLCQLPCRLGRCAGHRADQEWRASPTWTGLRRPICAGTRRWCR